MVTTSMKALAKNLEGRPENIFRILLNRLTRQQQHELLIAAGSRDLRIKIFRFSRHQNHLARRMGVKILNDMIRGEEPFLLLLEFLPPSRINKLMRKSCLRKQFAPHLQKTKTRQWFELISRVKPQCAVGHYAAIGIALHRLAFGSIEISGAHWTAIAEHNLSFAAIADLVRHDALLADVSRMLAEHNPAAFERLVFILGGKELEQRMKAWGVS